MKPASVWQKFIRDEDFKILSPTRLMVRFKSRRSHKILIEEQTDGWHLKALVVKQAPFGIDLFKWSTSNNRGLRLLGLQFENGSLFGTLWIPKPGLGAVEFQMHARYLATECDRLEFALTGEDHE